MDESLTSGGSYFALSRGCPQFSHLTLTGTAALSLPLLPRLSLLLLPAASVAALLPCATCECSKTMQRHTATPPSPPHLPLAHCAGGAIGAGIPLSVGAAVACPDRVVINLQVGMPCAGGCRRLCVFICEFRLAAGGGGVELTLLADWMHACLPCPLQADGSGMYSLQGLWTQVGGGSLQYWQKSTSIACSCSHAPALHRPMLYL